MVAGDSEKRLSANELKSRVDEILGEIQELKVERYPAAVGIGLDERYEGGLSIGKGLSFEGDLIHFCAFAK